MKKIKEGSGTTTLLMLRRYYLKDKPKYWVCVRPMPFTQGICFKYDTPGFNTIKEALDEAKAFCKWKGFKVSKIEKGIK